MCLVTKVLNCTTYALALYMCMYVPVTIFSLIVCIGFIWDSESPPLSYIMSVVESIDTEIRPSRVR